MGMVDVHAKFMFHKFVVLLDAIVTNFGKSSAAPSGELGQMVNV